MLGGIYSSQKCPICGNRFKDDGKSGLFCLYHPEYRATNLFVRYKGGIFKRFNDYDSAQRFLTGLRHRHQEGSFSVGDYSKDNPLGFENLALQWLEVKRNEVKASSYMKLQDHIGRTIREFSQRNIKDIGCAEIEGFLIKQKLKGANRPVSTKTRANIRSTLHAFWMWLRKRRVLPFAQIPEVPFELSRRNIIDRETQRAILNEVYRISSHVSPKIWIGIKWLCTYISIRPGELLKIKEGDFDLNLGVLFIHTPKENKPKTVPLLEEDVELLRSFPRVLPDLYFFRHVSGTSGVKAGQRFGDKYLYKWWKKACNNLGIEGVDLYGGTRQSSAKALREFHSQEEIERATMHMTNKTFGRHLQIELEDVGNVYGNMKRAAPNLYHYLVQKRKPTA